jgi:hypothetical protein
MEPRFRHSFADVRVHSDGRAAESARAVGAHAYAVGPSLVFGAGRYAPGSAEGRRLIAHELAHVVQQHGSASASLQPMLEIGAADDPAEREADRAADAVLAGGAAAPALAAGASASVRRKGNDRWQDSDSVLFPQNTNEPSESVDDKSTGILALRMRLGGRAEFLVGVPEKAIGAFAFGVGFRLQNWRWDGLIGAKDPMGKLGDTYSVEEFFAMANKLGGKSAKRAREGFSARLGLPLAPGVEGPREYPEDLAMRNLGKLTEQLSRDLQIRLARPRLPVKSERLIPGLPLSLQLGQPGAAHSGPPSRPRSPHGLPSGKLPDGVDPRATPFPPLDAESVGLIPGPTLSLQPVPPQESGAPPSRQRPPHGLPPQQLDGIDAPSPFPLLNSGPEPDPEARAEMEPRFRHSFADVRVHADGEAAESARAVGAHAYAVGRDVVFGAGRYAPASAEGKRLIAHELAHVVQQRGAWPALQPRLEIGAADDPAEREADHWAGRVAAGADARVALRAAPAVQRYGHDEKSCTDADLKELVWPGDQMAREWLGEAITTLAASPLPAKVPGLLKCYFMEAAPRLDVIRTNLATLKARFDASDYHYACDNSCTASKEQKTLGKTKVSWVFGGSGPIILCVNNLRASAVPAAAAARTIIHEFCHRYLHFYGDTYCNNCCEDLSPGDALKNPDSYAWFVQDLHFEMLAANARAKAKAAGDGKPQEQP